MSTTEAAGSFPRGPAGSSWLEITDRPDLGVNLKAPQANDDGKLVWSYSLIRQIQPGDLVFHYKKEPSRSGGSIVGCSRAVGRVWDDQITWGAHSRAARKARIVAYPRPGWCLGTEAYTELRKPVTLAQIVDRESDLRRIEKARRKRIGGPTYFPFTFYMRRPLRPAQAYLTTFPEEVVELFDELRNIARRLRSTAKSVRYIDEKRMRSRPLGLDYRQVNESAAISLRDPFAVDPDIVERGVNGHAKTQNLLADYVERQGYKPLRPQLIGPQYDVGWEAGSHFYVAEVKSLTDDNEERQLRYGLGQLLRYRHLLSAVHRRVNAVLAVERAPSDPSWHRLCAHLGVLLVWPGHFTPLDRRI